MSSWLSTSRRLVIFGAVGLGATAAYIVISSLLTDMGVVPWIASFLVYLCIIPLAYLGQRNLTFRSGDRHSSSLPKYIVTQSLGLALAALIPVLLSDIISPVYCFILVSALVAGVSYLLLALWAFPNDKEST
jgi:putative flippase GtrA